MVTTCKEFYELVRSLTETDKIYKKLYGEIEVQKHGNENITVWSNEAVYTPRSPIVNDFKWEVIYEW